MEWISVKDRLPEVRENPVLGYIKECNIVQMVWYHFTSNRWETPTGLGFEVTHWMPLPEPPKEDE